MQGKALPVEVRNIIVGKWLNNEGIANIIQYLIQYLGLVQTSNFSCAEPNANELKQRT